jgi:SnoaL-like domain
MSDTRVKVYNLYIAAWSSVPDAERARLLQESLSETIVFTNPQQTRRGISEVMEHLEGFQTRTPGGSFRMNNMVGWSTFALAEWQLVDALSGKTGRGSWLTDGLRRSRGGTSGAFPAW